MLQLKYVLLFTTLCITLNGCTSQAVSLQPQTHSGYAVAPYSLEALDKRYKQRGY